MQLDPRPFRTACQHDDGNTPAGEVLLIPDTAVGRDQQVKSVPLRLCQQIAIAQTIPPLGLRGGDGVP
jgi:hypothetical protein